MNGTSRFSWALLTDLYQLTMSCGYFRSGMAEHETVFHLFFRKEPFGGRYAIAAGLQQVVEILRDFRFTADDVDWLAGLNGNDDEPLFDLEFLDYLRDLEFTCDVDAVPEGTVVFAHQPLIRIQGPIIQCQILETLLLNIVNFQTLAATKASRICLAAGDEPVLEFGLRRAQGPDGGLSATRAAYIGGCAATSNVLAGKLFDIPVKGTHAHSWVMSFDTEREAFEAYAAALPNNCVFLVDTFDTLNGVDNAIEMAVQLNKGGHRIVGIRLDSGDLAELSRAARLKLDAAGFEDAAIVASNDLDEYRITKLKEDGARIGVWGVGTRLATCNEQPALGGVYKLGAIRSPDSEWKARVKLSEQAVKVSNPGILQVRRFVRDGQFAGDCLYDTRTGVSDSGEMICVRSGTERIVLPRTQSSDLLKPIFRTGRCVYDLPDIHTIRARAFEQTRMLPEHVRRLIDPLNYPTGLDTELHNEKLKLIAAHRTDSNPTDRKAES